MSAARRHKKHHEEEHENHERWLVSGYDMMTLLFAVFVVLFAISSTNVSKVKELQKSLQDAFSGPVLSGGKAMMDTGSTSDSGQASPTKPVQAISPTEAVKSAMSTQTEDEVAQNASDRAQASASGAEAAQREQQDFQSLKRRIDKLVTNAGLNKKVITRVSVRGLDVRLLTDGLFFDSGSAAIKPGAVRVIDQIGKIIADEQHHPVEVEGHTDNQPIATSQYPSNWQLSGARAGAVLQRLATAGVSQQRMMLTGFGSQRPLGSNATAGGRARNRRVEVVLTRLHGATSSQGGGTS